MGSARQACTKFDHLGVFSYSDEDTSASFHLDGKVDGRTIYNRKRRILALQRKVSRARCRSFVGQTLPILVEGPSEESELLLQGRLESQAPEIDGVCLINDSEVGEVKSGEFRTVRITRAMEHDLLGKIVG